MIGRLARFALAAAILAAVPAAATERQEQETENRGVYQIDLEDQDGRHASVTKVVVAWDGGALVAKTRHGISRRNQNRIDYSAVPLLGKLSEHRYDKPDFAPGNRVGGVRVAGDDLFLVLDAEHAVAIDQIRKIAVLNGQFAFETRRRPKLQAALRSAPESREIGGVFWNGGDTLMALVRPFVVTDSALW